MIADDFTLTSLLLRKSAAKLILCSLLINTCNAAIPSQNEQPGAWSTDVIGIKEMHLSAEYWIDQTDNASEVLKEQQEITQFNRRLYNTNEHMVDLSVFENQISGQDLKQRILTISKPNKSDLYRENGDLLDTESYQSYSTNLNLDNIPESAQVRFALVVNRSNMRTYPTDNSVYKTRDDKNLDRFQENGLFPGDALAVLHVSADGEWSFVQSYNYAAWVRSENIAIGDRKTVLEYGDANQFLLITGSKVWTSFNPDIPAISELQLDMGIRLPLAETRNSSNNLHGQNPYTSHTVLLPVRNDQGELELKQALIARNKDVNRGYIPFTPENITQQAFKFLGERYGWGHSYNARDCTGFVMEVYKTFGIQMPRNTGQQGKGSFGENKRFTVGSSEEEKLQALQEMDIGDLIYVPGHVLMYIGSVDGEPYVIHDVSAFRYIDDDGEYYKGTLNGVSVTPLIPLYGNRESTYVDLIYNIKRVR